MSEDDDDRAEFERYKRFKAQEAAARSATPTILTLWDEWIGQHRAGPTLTARQRYRRWLLIEFPFSGESIALGNLQPRQCTVAIFKSWQQMMLRTPGPGGKLQAPGSVNLVRIAVQAMLSHYVEDGRLPVNPLRGTKRVEHYDRKRVGSVSASDVQRIAAHLPLIDGIIYRHLFATACRVSNLLTLKKSQILRDTSEIVVTLKGGRRAKILVPDDTLQEMVKLAEVSPSEYVYPSPQDPTGGPVNYFTFYRRVRHAIQAAGVADPEGERLGTHAPRHGRARDILKRTGDITLVKDQLGHSTLAHTMRYVGDEGERREALRAALNSTDSVRKK